MKEKTSYRYILPEHLSQELRQWFYKARECCNAQRAGKLERHTVRASRLYNERLPNGLSDVTLAFETADRYYRVTDHLGVRSRFLLLRSMDYRPMLRKIAKYRVPITN